MSMSWRIGALAAGMVVTWSAQAQFAWTFDCGVEGWITTPFHTMGWTNTGGEGRVLLTFSNDAEEPGNPYDPVFQSPSGNAFDLAETPYIILEFEANNVPGGDAAALFLFGGGAAWRVGWPENGITWGSGFNRVVLDISTADVFKLWGDEGVDVDNTPIEIVRFDIPDNAPFAGYENAALAVDFVAVSDDPNFVPVQDTTPCADSPFPQSPSATPVASGAGLALLAGTALGVGLWRIRRRKR